MSSVRVRGEVVERNHRRGCFKLPLKGSDLSAVTRVESNTFQIGIFNLMLVLLLRHLRNNQTKIAKIFLQSCDNRCVTTEVRCSLRRQDQTCQLNECKPAERTSRQDQTCQLNEWNLRTVLPFARTECPKAACLEDDLLLDRKTTATVVIDLKSIRKASDEERRRLADRTGRVKLEIYDNTSIEHEANQNSSGRVGSCEKKRTEYVHGTSSMREWNEHKGIIHPADHDSISCYLFVKQSRNGESPSVRSLSGLDLEYTFQDACDHGDRTLKLFREETEIGEDLQRVDENTILVECRLSEPPYKDEDFSSVRRLLLQKNMPLPDLADFFAEEFNLRPGEFRISMEGPSGETDITDKQDSLNECGIITGSRLTVKKCAPKSDIPSQPCPVNVTDNPTSESASSEEFQTPRASESSSSEVSTIITEAGSDGVTSSGQRTQQHQNQEGSSASAPPPAQAGLQPPTPTSQQRPIFSDV